MSPSLIPPAENLTTWWELRLIVWALCVCGSVSGPELSHGSLWGQHYYQDLRSGHLLRATSDGRTLTYPISKHLSWPVLREFGDCKKNLPIGKGSECVMTKINLNLNIMIWCFSGCLLALPPKLHCGLGSEHSAYICDLECVRRHSTGHQHTLPQTPQFKDHCIVWISWNTWSFLLLWKHADFIMENRLLVFSYHHSSACKQWLVYLWAIMYVNVWF